MGGAGSGGPVTRCGPRKGFPDLWRGAGGSWMPGVPPRIRCRHADSGTEKIGTDRNYNSGRPHVVPVVSPCGRAAAETTGQTG